uniref:Uncharacterized protein n=1 Tax=Anguilla anguilla TaxID=7936 RepID=A0A0E9QL61_ANGAN
MKYENTCMIDIHNCLSIVNDSPFGGVHADLRLWQVIGPSYGMVLCICS